MKTSTKHSLFIAAIMLIAGNTLHAQALLVASGNGSTHTFDLASIESIVFTNNNLVVHDNDCEDNYFNVFFTDYATLDGTIRVDETADNTQNLLVYPNPAGDVLNIQMKGAANKIAYVFNTTGSMVMSERLTANNAVLNITDLPAGVYVLRINQQNIQFIVQ